MGEVIAKAPTTWLFSHCGSSSSSVNLTLSTEASQRRPRTDGASVADLTPGVSADPSGPTPLFIYVNFGSSTDLLWMSSVAIFAVGPGLPPARVSGRELLSGTLLKRGKFMSLGSDKSGFKSKL